MNSNVITPEGYSELQQELDTLWRKERREVTEKVQWAASLGDRSENADYQYNKKRLREIDRRIRHLRKRLAELRIIEYNPAQEGKAFFGAWVTLIDEESNQLLFRIVGPDEIYDKKDYVSVNSPVVRAVLGKPVGADISVQTPSGSKEWTISRIEYQT